MCQSEIFATYASSAALKTADISAKGHSVAEFTMKSAALC